MQGPLDDRDVCSWYEEEPRDLGALKMQELKVWSQKIKSAKYHPHIKETAGFSYNYPTAPSPHDVATGGYIPSIY